MSFKNVEDRRNYDKQWRKTPKGKKYVKRQRKRWLKKKSSKKILGRAYHKYTTSEKGRESRRKWRERVRRECIAAYGGKCKCCGEWREEFLTIDHIKGGGHQHRLSIKGVNFSYWLKRQGYPKRGYRLLCWNCNTSIGMRGYCPHQIKKKK